MAVEELLGRRMSEGADAARAAALVAQSELDDGSRKAMFSAADRARSLQPLTGSGSPTTTTPASRRIATCRVEGDRALLRPVEAVAPVGHRLRADRGPDPTAITVSSGIAHSKVSPPMAAIGASSCAGSAGGAKAAREHDSPGIRGARRR